VAKCTSLPDFPRGKAFRRQGVLSNELAAQQLSHARQLQDQFEAPFDRIRPEFDEIFRQHGRRIDSFAQFRGAMFEAVTKLDFGFLWKSEISR
jgi:hypothetical protein